MQAAPAILEAIRAERPDVVLQDVQMPGLDLAGLVAAVRHDPDLRSLPVLLFTAAVDAHETARRIGADGCVRKPFEGGHLKRAIDEVTGHRAPR